MKHCTTCQLEYTDEMLRFCRIDGTSLAPTVFPETAATLVFSPSRRNLEKVSPLSSAESIAVLPFVNMSAESENEFFCDGLAEELTNALAKLGKLRVAARTSSFSFKRKDNTVRDIGRELNVSTILEGSVRKSEIDCGSRRNSSMLLTDITSGRSAMTDSWKTSSTFRIRFRWQ